MSVIHMDTETVRSLVDRFRLSSSTTLANLGTLKNIGTYMDWVGQSREEFFSHANNCRSKLITLLEELDSLALQLEDEINQWENCDNDSSLFSITDNNVISQAIKTTAGDFLYATGWLFKKQIGSVLDFFQKNKKGKLLLKEAIEANITFQYTDEDGNIIRFGAENGEVIEISWVDPKDNSNLDGLMGGYVAGPPPTIIINSDAFKYANAYDLRETISHEMQHAIDYRSGRSNLEIANRPYQDIANSNLDHLSQEELNNYDWSDYEKNFEASCNERVKTEISAHARGYEFNPEHSLGEGTLNQDQYYTEGEIKIILDDKPTGRGYADNYIEDIQREFSDKGLAVEVDVYWDDVNNCVQVEILDVDKISD